VVEPGREWKVLATNKLADGCMASPAAVGKSLLVRTKTHLYCLEKKGLNQRQRICWRGPQRQQGAPCWRCGLCWLRVANGTYRNLVEMHRCQAERLGARPALRYREHRLIATWPGTTIARRYLRGRPRSSKRGIEPGDRVGLLGENSINWPIVDMAILTAGAVNLPPHAPLTAPQIHYQLADAGRLLVVRLHARTARQDPPNPRGFAQLTWRRGHGSAGGRGGTPFPGNHFCKAAGAPYRRWLPSWRAARPPQLAPIWRPSFTRPAPPAIPRG